MQPAQNPQDGFLTLTCIYVYIHMIHIYVYIHMYHDASCIPLSPKNGPTRSWIPMCWRNTCHSETTAAAVGFLLSFPKRTGCVHSLQIGMGVGSVAIWPPVFCKAQSALVAYPIHSSRRSQHVDLKKAKPATALLKVINTRTTLILICASTTASHLHFLVSGIEIHPRNVFERAFNAGTYGSEAIIPARFFCKNKVSQMNEDSWLCA